MAEPELTPRTKRLRDTIRHIVISKDSEDVKTVRFNKAFRDVWDEKVFVDGVLDEEAAVYVLHAMATRPKEQSLEGKRVRHLLIFPVLLRSYLSISRKLPYNEFMELVNVCIEDSFRGDHLKEYRSSLAQLLDYGSQYSGNRKELKLMLRLPGKVDAGPILVATPFGQPERKAELGILGQAIDYGYQDFTFIMWTAGKELSPFLPEDDATYRDVWHFLMYAKKDHYGKLVEKLKSNPNSNRQAVVDFFGWKLEEIEEKLGAESV